MGAGAAGTPSVAPVTPPDNSAAMQAEIEALKATIAKLQAAPPVVAGIAAEDKGKPGFFRVKLKDCAEFIVKADDRLDAISAYKKLCGVQKTEHECSVQYVECPNVQPARVNGVFFWYSDGSTPELAERRFPKEYRQRKPRVQKVMVVDENDPEIDDDEGD